MIAMEISQEAEWVFSKVLVSGIYCNNNQEKEKKERHNSSCICEEGKS